MGEIMGQNRGHLHLSCCPQKLNLEEKDGKIRCLPNNQKFYFSVLSGNRLGIFVVVLAGKFLFVSALLEPLKDFWSAADCKHEYP